MLRRSRHGISSTRSVARRIACSLCSLIAAFSVCLFLAHSFVPCPRLPAVRKSATRSTWARNAVAGDVVVLDPSVRPAVDANETQATPEMKVIEEESNESGTVKEPQDDSLLPAAMVGAVAAALAAVIGPVMSHVEPVAELLKGLAASLQPMVDAYAIPLAMGLPPAVLHWSHAGNTVTFLAVIGGFGAMEGLASRQRRLNGDRPGGSGLHSSFMIVVLVYTALSVVGALSSMRYDQQPMYESPHAWSATVVALLLIGNAALGFSFKGDRKADGAGRDLHAKLGAAWIAAIVVNAILGIWLGLSFSTVETAMSAYNPVGNLGLDSQGVIFTPGEEFPE